MAPNIFMSYSRREVGFVDDLSYRLEKEGFHIWLDYRSLIPGTPWAEQINKGLDESDVIVLVISKESIASKYVELEWRRILSIKDKRVILAIFEAVDLPSELENLEWVDFRGNYEAGIKELVEQLKSPVNEERRAPETGFKIPGVVWWAFFLSLTTAVMSLFSLWSLFVPFFLIPLPYRILKRDFNITQVQAALWMLPLISFLTALASKGVDDPSGAMTGASATALAVFLFSLPIVPILVAVLRSKGMQRWGKPQASLSKFAGLYKPEIKQPEPVSFFIDHAPQDRRVAEEIRQTFKKHKHEQAADTASAKSVFVLLSEFKNDTEADPQNQIVFPVMIQTCEPAEKLSKIQWIDFRGGVRNLDAMAKLLPDPAKLLRALGVRPTGNQLTLPPIIMSMYYFLILLGIFILGSVVKNAWEYPQNILLILPQTIVVLVLIGLLMFFSSRALVKRQGRLASFFNFSLALMALGLLAFLQSFLPAFTSAGDAYYSETNQYSLAEAYPILAYVVGIFVMGIFLAFRYRDVRRWFPAKAK